MAKSDNVKSATALIPNEIDYLIEEDMRTYDRSKVWVMNKIFKDYYTRNGRLKDEQNKNLLKNED
jgi:hypothetical protein